MKEPPFHPGKPFSQALIADGQKAKACDDQENPL